MSPNRGRETDPRRGKTESNSKKKDRLSTVSAVAAVLSAVAALVAAVFSGYVSYFTSVLESNISEKQIQTQQSIADLQDSTKRQQIQMQHSITALQESTKLQLSERESSFKRAELFTKSIKELNDDKTSSLALLGLWPLYSKPDERRIIIAAALHVGKEDTIRALMQLGAELDPYLQTVIADAVRSNNPRVAENAKTVINAVRTERTRKEQILADLLKPMVAHLEKTDRAIKNYSAENRVPEEKILLEGNTAIRALLSDKADLIPEDLKPDADRLIKHYDDWLKEYERRRRGKEPDQKLVFAPKHSFPVESAKRFEERFCKISTEVHGELTDADVNAIQIKQVPTRLEETPESDRQWTRLTFSVFVERAGQECILDWIDRVVYVMDKRWWRSGNEFIRHDRSDKFEFRMKVWGVTRVKAKIYVPGQAPVLREGYMDLNDISFFKAPQRQDIDQNNIAR